VLTRHFGPVDAASDVSVIDLTGMVLIIDAGVLTTVWVCRRLHRVSVGNE
jgi:hypothetical protein